MSTPWEEGEGEEGEGEREGRRGVRWAPELACGEEKETESPLSTASKSATVAPFSPVVQEKEDTQPTNQQQQQQVCVCVCKRERTCIAIYMHLYTECIAVLLYV